MPKIRTREEVETEKENQPQLDFITIDPDELGDALAGLPGEGTKIFLYRIKPQGRPAYLAEFLPSDFSLEAIKLTYGGGSYSIKAKRPNEATLNYRVDIEGLQPFTSNPITHQYGRYVDRERSEELTRARDNEEIGGRHPVFGLLLQQLDKLSTQLQGGMPPRQNDDDHEKRFLEKMLLYKSLFAQPVSDPIANMSGVVTDLIKQGLEIGANAANPESGSSWVSIIEKLAPMAEKALTLISSQGRSSPAPRDVSPEIRSNVRSNMDSISSNVRSNISEDPLLMPMIKRENVKEPVGPFAIVANLITPFLPMVIGAASRDVDPASYGQILLDNIPPEKMEEVKSWLESPAWFADLCSLDPRIENQVAWWHDFHDMIQEALTESHEKNPGGNSNGDLVE